MARQTIERIRQRSLLDNRVISDRLIIDTEEIIQDLIAMGVDIDPRDSLCTYANIHRNKFLSETRRNPEITIMGWKLYLGISLEQTEGHSFRCPTSFPGHGWGTIIVDPCSKYRITYSSADLFNAATALPALEQNNVDPLLERL